MKKVTPESYSVRVNLRFSVAGKRMPGFWESLQSKPPYQRAKWLRRILEQGWANANPERPSGLPHEKKRTRTRQPSQTHDASSTGFSKQNSSFEEVMGDLDQYV